MTTAERLKRWAQPDCPECDGDGVVCVATRQNPDGHKDIACDCTKDAREAENGPDESNDPDGPWAGGFCSNH